MNQPKPFNTKIARVVLILVYLFNINICSGILKFISVNDIDLDIISTAENHQGLCGQPNEILKKQASKICIFNNTSDIKSSNDDISRLDNITVDERRCQIATPSLYDKEKQENLLFKYIYTVVSTNQRDVETKSYQMILCTHLLYIKYIEKIDYFKVRLETKTKCSSDEECTNDLSANQDIVKLFQMFSASMFSIDDNSIGNTFSSIVIDKLSDDQVKGINHFLTSLRNIAELDSAKPSAHNQADCMNSALENYNKDTRTFDYSIWEYMYESLVSKFIKTDPITDYTPAS
jgi:hypothetical protein